MIVRERPDLFLLFEQHEHALIAGEFALRWRERPRPFESTVYAIANHDLAWREADRAVLWNEERDRSGSGSRPLRGMPLQHALRPLPARLGAAGGGRVPRARGGAPGQPRGKNVRRRAREPRAKLPLSSAL